MLLAALCLAGCLICACLPTSRALGATTAPSDLSLNARRLLRTSSGALSVSGTHWLRRSADNQYTVQHGSSPQITLTGIPSGPQRIKQSGPYSLIGGTVFVAAPKNTARLVLRTGTANTDLFGPHVVWSTADGQIRQQYLNPEGPAKKVLARTGAAGPVAVWGPRSAWLDTSGRIHVAGRLGFERRTVPAGPRAHDLRLNYATLSWTAGDGSIHVMNLGESEPRGRRVDLHPPYAIDGQRIAGIDASGRVHVQNLPFRVGRQAPWIISAQTTATIRSGRPWKPRFDVSKPVRNAKLVIYGSGSPTGTLTSPARYGTVGGLRWDGKDASGRAAAPICYNWVFSAEAVDGSGPVISDLGPHPAGSLNVTPAGGDGGIGMGCFLDLGPQGSG